MSAEPVPDPPPEEATLTGFSLMLDQCRSKEQKDRLVNALSAFGNGDPNGFGVRFYTVLEANLQAMGRHAQDTFTISQGMVKALGEVMDPTGIQKAMDANHQKFDNTVSVLVKALSELHRLNKKERSEEAIKSEVRLEMLDQKLDQLFVETGRLKANDAATRKLLVLASALFGSALLFYALVYLKGVW